MSTKSWCVWAIDSVGSLCSGLMFPAVILLSTWIVMDMKEFAALSVILVGSVWNRSRAGDANQRCVRLVQTLSRSNADNKRLLRILKESVADNKRLLGKVRVEHLTTPPVSRSDRKFDLASLECSGGELNN